MYRIVYIFNYTTIILPREREIDFNCDVNHITIFTIMIKRRELNDEAKKGKMRGFAAIYRNSTSSRAKIEIANYRRILSIDLVDQARCAQRLFALVKRIGRIN